MAVAIESKGDAMQVEVVLVSDLGIGRRDPLDRAVIDDVCEFGV